MTTGFGTWTPAMELQENFDDRELGERAHFMFEYDPDTGHLVSRFTGDSMGYSTGTGHSLVKMDRRSFSASVIVWVMHHFARPKGRLLKRVNRNPADHRIENLVCGKSEINPSPSGFSVKVVEPGYMPVWLPEVLTYGEAQEALRAYESAHKGRPPPPCVVPEEVVRELTKIGYTPKTYAPGQSRLSKFMQEALGINRARRKAALSHFIDDLV